MSTSWNHDDLAADLAAHLRGNTRDRMVWIDMQLGPSGSPRPDVYTIECSYSRFIPIAYEVKVTRADFLSDVTSGKALRYLDFAGSLVFAVPAGLVDKGEIPPGCGLIVRGENGWRHTKKPTIQKVATLPRDAWMKLLLDGRGRDVGRGIEPKPRQANRWAQEERARKMLGEELGRMLRDRASARYHLEEEIKRLNEERAKTADQVRDLASQRVAGAQRELDAIHAAIAEAAQGLGLEKGVGAYEIRAALRALRPDEDARRLKDAAEMLRRHADGALRDAMEIERTLTTMEQQA